MESTGYPMASIEKTMRLLELLRVINEDAFLSENLTLKGGTAINIIHYSEIPRLSVDLDFDLARNTPKEEMLAIKDKVSAKIRHLAASMGYFLSDPRPNYVIHQTELYYQSATGNRDKIKLDINCLSRCHVYDTLVRETAILSFLRRNYLSGCFQNMSCLVPSSRRCWRGVHPGIFLTLIRWNRKDYTAMSNPHP